MTRRKPKLDHKVNVDWFKTQLKRVGLSQNKMAEILGISQPTVSHFFAGRRSMQLDEASKWALALKVPMEEVLTNSGIKVAKDSKKAKLMSIAGILGPNHVVDRDMAAFKASPHLKTAPNHTPYDDVWGLRVRNLGPDYGLKDGSIVYFRTEVPGFDPNKLNALCVLKLKGGKHEMLREIRRGLEPGHFDLLYFNGTLAEEAVQIEWATPVLGVLMPVLA